MALILKDRVKETTTTTGTGTITLAGASIGYQSFSVIGNANTTYYCIAGQGTTEWEVGIGTYTSSGTTLSRDTILASSNSGSAVTFSAGTKDVFVVYPAGKSVNLDASGNATALGTPASGVVTNLTGTASININGTVGATTPTTGAFTTVSASTSVTTPSVTNAGTLALSATGVNIVTASTNGSERMRIDSSGNVGIGSSTNSLSKLLVVGATTGTVDLATVGVQIRRNGGTTNWSFINNVGGSMNLDLYDSTTPVIALRTSTDTTNFYNQVCVTHTASANRYITLTGSNGAAPVIGTSAGDLAFSPAATERMRINSSGIVLIGTTSASGSNLLQVNSDALVNTLTVGRGPGGLQTNAVLGYQALNSGGANVGSSVAIGYQALYTATASGADRQIAIGYQALYSNNDSTGAVNIGIGYLAAKAATGKSNVFIGGYNSYLRTTGDNNTFVGNASGTNFSSVPTGSNNTALGASALGSLTSGYSNVAVGQNCGTLCATGACNVFVGEVSGYNATGSRNVFVGGGNTIGGYSAGQTQTSGDLNTYIGSAAGGLMTTGSYNVILGSYTGNSGGLDIRTLSNNIVLSDGQANVRQYYDGTNSAWVWNTGASERMRIDSSGNVGIGTSSPASKLQINADGNSTQQLRIQNTQTSYTTDLALFTHASGDFSIGLTNSALPLTNQTITFKTNNSSSGQITAMRIDSSGNVGIGTSSPSTYGKFAVQTQTSNAPTVAITGSGLSPQLNHYINDSTSVLRNLNQIQFVTGSSDISNYQGYMTFSTMGSAGGTISERMRIDSSGNVGIGTSSPGSKLDVKGTLRLSGSTSGYVGLAPAAAAGSTTYTLPSADGTSGQVLSTNGSGTLSWAASGGITTTTGSAPYYGARAWVNFNGTGTVAINASVNVSSITDNGVGDYTVNFTTAMPDANYSWSYGSQYSNSGAAARQNIFPMMNDGANLVQTTSIRFYTGTTAGYYDCAIVALSVFR